jgi:hypothetical protein
MRSRLVRLLLAALALFLVVAQFVGPGRTNPPVEPAQALEAHATVPPSIGATLRRACFDCHSDETRWPLYARVAPVSWFVAGHVNEGREHLNFSRWGGYHPVERADLLDDACKEARSGAMPLPSYLLLHGDARLSSSDVSALCEWTAAEAARQEHTGNGDTHHF